MRNLDELTIEQIYELIAIGQISKQDVIDYYNNEWWDEVPT